MSGKQYLKNQLPVLLLNLLGVLALALFLIATGTSRQAISFIALVWIAIGIFLGVFCSQFITAMLLTTYGKSYELSWTLFPDTVLLTIGFFIFSFLIVGIFNTRTIRKTKIIDMLAAEKENDPELKKSR